MEELYNKLFMECLAAEESESAIPDSSPQFDRQHNEKPPIRPMESNDRILMGGNYKKAREMWKSRRK